MMGDPLLVMLVEDNLDHAELVRRTLAEHRVANHIQHFTDGQSALDYLFRRDGYADPDDSPRPHVILLDLRLPRVDGLEVLKTIKAADALRQIPVVVLTTSDAHSDVTSAYNYHANSYLVKPFGFDEFTHMLDELGFYWLRWNTQPQL